MTDEVDRIRREIKRSAEEIFVGTPASGSTQLDQVAYQARQLATRRARAAGATSSEVDRISVRTFYRDAGAAIAIEVDFPPSLGPKLAAYDQANNCSRDDAEESGGDE